MAEPTKPAASNDSSPTSPISPITPTSAHPKDLKHRMKASYDAIAPVYNKWTLDTNYAIRLEQLDKLIPHLTNTHRLKVSVLELGCGAGIPATQKLASYPKFSITANDLSSTQIALAKENLAEHGNRVHLVESDMMYLNLPIQAFDAVTAFYSIIHLPRDQQKIMIRIIFKWLKPGGYFLGNFAAEEMAGKETQRWLDQEKGWMFWSSWGAEKTVEIIEETGLVIEEQEVKTDKDGASFLWILARRPVRRE
jgi:ubiquinone/menaquinone biosynthesis C-methylase UbiE